MDKLKVVDAAWHGMKGAWGMAKDQLTGDSGRSAAEGGDGRPARRGTDLRIVASMASKGTTAFSSARARRPPYSSLIISSSKTRAIATATRSDACADTSAASARCADVSWSGAFVSAGASVEIN